MASLKKNSLYIKMNCRSLVSLKRKNGLTDLSIYFFLLFALIEGWLKKKKKLEKLPGKLENLGKTDDIHNYFFVLFVIVLKKFSGKKKSGQL
jgi:hypothetical protein